MLTRIRQKGSSLIELMISMLLGLTSLSLLASVAGYGIGTNANLLGQSRLTEEMRAAIFLIGREVRRAGINGNAMSVVQNPTDNPAVFSSTITLGSYPGEPANSCILFSYDANFNGNLDLENPNERYGFRLKDGAVEVRQGGTGCTQGGWQDLTDSQVVEITALIFTLKQTVNGQVTSYQVDIEIVGELIGKPEFNRRYQETLMVRAYD
ncbi:hypothetical protein [Lacimicrobium alkaliphilum]|uniref:Prepilin cleavage protein n=1 Tax=Lacimicrobium alkaliphilum TaxID=1526571 RepID=A0A0U2JJA6_9ALTE|nr:hypothetical protein [Lacimicrobium alkaliphilum]ALS99174.1 hypothetical protein AT746_13505 [Lacimicrobium alkaliphilum]